MARKVSEQDIRDFYESLTPEQYKIVKEADDLWLNFFEGRLAEEALDEWEKAGRPRGYTIEEAKSIIKAERFWRQILLDVPAHP